MIDALVARFDSRLATLQALLDKAAAQWKAAGKDPEVLVDARLADDMAPLAKQVVFVCHQPGQFLDWATRSVSADRDVPTRFAEMGALIAATRARLAAFDGDDALFAKVKDIKLPGDMSLSLDGGAYVGDWVMPNFYFHLVTAYAILRAQGVDIGKADYMAHLMPLIRRGAG